MYSNTKTRIKRGRAVRESALDEQKQHNALMEKMMLFQVSESMYAESTQVKGCHVFILLSTLWSLGSIFVDGIVPKFLMIFMAVLWMLAYYINICEDKELYKVMAAVRKTGRDDWDDEEWG